MFDDFCPSATSRESRARFRGSFAAAILIYAVSSAAIVGATATVHKIAEEKEAQVEFAPAPEPEPPPPPPPPAAPAEASPRPRAKRPELAAPTKISDEKLKESSKPLSAAGESGPVDGFLDGVEGGKGTAPAAPAPAPAPLPPPPKAEPLVAPVEMSQNGKPRYPPAAKRKGIEGTVVVAFDVLEDGTVASPRIVSGPDELHDCVLRVVASWHYQPAHRGPERVRFRMKKSIVFRLEDG